MGDDGFFAQTGMPFSDEYSPSAPRGILVGIVPQIVKSNPFDGTARGSSLSVWLEELDKMMRVNPNISKLWMGYIDDVSADDTPIAEKLTEMAQVTVNNASVRCGSSASVRLAAEKTLKREIRQLRAGAASFY